MDVHGEFDEIGILQRTGDPYDPFALQKAALIAQAEGSAKAIELINQAAPGEGYIKIKSLFKFGNCLNSHVAFAF